MKTTQYNFLIGWNNQTKKREIKKAIRNLNNKKVLGFTINKNLVGYWNKEQENSFKIEIINSIENAFNDNKAKQLKRLLEKELKQYLVLTFKQNIEIL